MLRRLINMISFIRNGRQRKQWHVPGSRWQRTWQAMLLGCRVIRALIRNLHPPRTSTGSQQGSTHFTPDSSRPWTVTATPLAGLLGIALQRAVAGAALRQSGADISTNLLKTPPTSVELPASPWKGLPDMEGDVAGRKKSYSQAIIIRIICNIVTSKLSVISNLNIKIKYWLLVLFIKIWQKSW